MQQPDRNELQRLQRPETIRMEEAEASIPCLFTYSLTASRSGKYPLGSS